MFVRKFFIVDGQIEILGEKQVMLPFSVLDSIDSKDIFDVACKEVKKTMDSYAKKIGSSPGGMIKSVQDIYETMGLGKMKIIKLDADKKSLIARLEKVKVKNTGLIGGVIAGLFSSGFNKDITEKDISIAKKSSYIDITIK